MGKLVRDGIPRIISSSGRVPVLEHISGRRLERALRLKLREEAAEASKATTVRALREELADLMEVVDALARAKRIRKRDIEREKSDKRKRKGGFRNGLYLKRIEAHRPSRERSDRVAR